MNKIVFALDLDFTLSHFEGDGIEALHQIVAEHGVSLDMARTTREEVEKTGFSFERYIHALEEKTGTSLPAQVLKPKMRDWLVEHLRLYDGVVEFMDRAADEGIPIYIVTFGDNVFQRHKISILNIPGGILTCGPAGEYISKAVALQKILESREDTPRILFLDDNPSELELVQKTFPPSQVRCVRMYRKDGPHKQTQCMGNNYASVTSLDRVWNLIRYWK